MRIAVDPQSKNKGVMLAMNNQIHAARYVTKTHTQNVETFQSGAFGLIGEVYPDRVMYATTPLRRQTFQLVDGPMPEVEIVAMYGGATTISERHRHRYEVNSRYIEPLERQGLVFAGMSPDGLLPEIVERPDHPWFVGVQFHPELKSKPFDPHPLFAGFIAAALEQSRLV